MHKLHAALDWVALECFLILAKSQGHAVISWKAKSQGHAVISWNCLNTKKCNKSLFQEDHIASWHKNKSRWKHSLKKQDKSLNQSESLISVLNFNKNTLFHQLISE